MEDVQEYYMLLDNLGDLAFAMSLAGPLAAAQHDTGGGVTVVEGALSKQQFSHSCAVVLTEMRKAEAAVGGRKQSSSSTLSPVTVDVLFCLFDADGDGRLSIDEITEAMGSHGSPQLHRDKQLKGFGSLGIGGGLVQLIQSVFGSRG
jgi:hypothetical protein